MSSEQPIHEKYDILYHYTTADGLKGKGTTICRTTSVQHYGMQQVHEPPEQDCR